MRRMKRRRWRSELVSGDVVWFDPVHKALHLVVRLRFKGRRVLGYTSLRCVRVCTLPYTDTRGNRDEGDLRLKGDA